MDRPLIRMSKRSFGAFLKAISGPPTPDPELVEILKRTPPWQDGAVLTASEADEAHRKS
jgi:uncharacterized protein (DUF1778 family)